MEMYIMEILKKIKKKEKEFIYMKMEINLMEYLKKIKNMREKDIFITKMVIYIMVK